MREELLIPLAAIMLPAVIVPTALAFRHAAKKREHQHLQRMKALETGQPVPGEVTWPAAVACSLIGAGVPLIAFSLTFVVAISSSHPRQGELWIAPTIVSVCALLSSIAIAKVMTRAKTPITLDSHRNGKPPVYDPDAYDVVGTRG